MLACQSTCRIVFISMQRVCSRCSISLFPHVDRAFRQASSGSNTRGDIGRRYYKDLESNKNCDDNDPSKFIYDRDFVDMQVDDFSEIYLEDEKIKAKIETILSEYEHMKYDSVGKVPSVITKKDMEMMLEEGTTVQNRMRLLHYLYKREMDKRQAERRKQRDKEEIRRRSEARLRELGTGDQRSGLLTENGELIYGLWHNTLFARIPENRLKSGLSLSRLSNAAQFGRKLILDFGFEDYMNKHSIRNSVDQVQEAYGMNRFDYRDPFDLWFCNFDENSFTGKYCTSNAIQNLHSGSMITVKPDCMTNYFDRSRLVYLSPNAKESLGPIVKNDDIYIIGVYNDKGNSQPVSLRKANKLKIRTKCLPIDTHLLWQGPSKALCINHVVGILLEVLSNGGDWYAALTKHIPPRKIKPPEMIVAEERRRLSKIRSKAPKFNLRLDFD